MWQVEVLGALPGVSLAVWDHHARAALRVRVRVRVRVEVEQPSGPCACASDMTQ